MSDNNNNLQNIKNTSIKEFIDHKEITKIINENVNTHLISKTIYNTGEWVKIDEGNKMKWVPNNEMSKKAKNDLDSIMFM